MFDELLTGGMVARPHEVEQTGKLQRMTKRLWHRGDEGLWHRAVITIILSSPLRSRNSALVCIQPDILRLLPYLRLP